MDRETVAVDALAPASLRVKRTTLDGPRSYRDPAQREGKLVIEIGATRSLWLLILAVIVGTALATVALIHGGNVAAACFLTVFGGICAGVLGLLRGRGRVELVFSEEAVKITTRTILAAPGFIQLELARVRRVHVTQNDAGHSVSAELDSGGRVWIVDELADQRTARYLADALAEETERAKKRAVKERGPALLAEPEEDPPRASRRRRP
ncbi:MAG: hypothetical protein HOV80_25570 [Polyangiaceae bacterium]|nr:hypothetical protein [Polyangiaceae bacterium]